tara:strand:- start:4436 stop:8209 length:3774 start_codon:yes stop_codon:yes gene_type:complete
MPLFGILKFSLRERINKKGVRFISFPDGTTSVVNTKSLSKIDRWAKVSDDGELMELLGPVGDKRTESKVIHTALNISPCHYPSYTLSKNVDYPRDENVHQVFSVDNESTKDIDDALSVSVIGNKTIVGIHITDVAHTLYNRLDENDKTELLSFAMNRASSAYTDIENTPMLPPYLTYNELSLSKNVIRKSITLWVTFDNASKQIVEHTFENCYVKNISPVTYDTFKEKHSQEFGILSSLAYTNEPTDIVAWTMLLYNKYFANLEKDILLRHQEGTEAASYSHSVCKKIHHTIGCLYTHATSPIRRYADLYNQMKWHNWNVSLDLHELNVSSANVYLFHRKHSVMELSYACRKNPQKVKVLSDKTYGDTVRVVNNNNHSTYIVPRYDTFYEGSLIPGTECYVWGILKNGVSTLRIQTTDTTKDISQVHIGVLDDIVQRVVSSKCPVYDVKNNIKMELDTLQFEYSMDIDKVLEDLLEFRKNGPHGGDFNEHIFINRIIDGIHFGNTITYDCNFERFDKEDVESVLGHQLDEFQSKCYDVISSGDDLFGAAPTGSGKTGVAMTAIHQAFHNNTRAIYTSPIKSLSNEKYGDFSNKLDSRVSLLTGDIKLRCTPPGGDGASELIIMTAEILRNKLCAQHPDPDLTDVSVVIIDECHYINDTDRGTVWEETFMMLPTHIQIVALSATLDKPERFCEWLSKRRPTKLVQRFDRHVPLYFGTIHANQLQLMDNKDSKTYVWNKIHERPSYAKLIKSLVELEMCPAIIFCMGRRKCVMAAESITDNLVLPKKPFKPKESASDAEHDAFALELKEYNNHVVEYKRKFDALQRKYLGKFRKQLESIPGYEDFIMMLQKGVAYHHAAMIPILREFVEVLFRQKLIMAVFATETLGCGIDMPARTVVFTELDKPCGEQSKRLLKTEEFMQMAGRAGRRGRDVKGYVLYYSTKNVRVSYSTFAGIALCKPPQATSQLQITPDLVLRNFSQGCESMRKSLYSAELMSEVEGVSNEYEAIQNKIPSETLERIIELDHKLAGTGFIKLTPKQTKQAKNEIKSLLGTSDIFQARKQYDLYYQIQDCTSTINTLWTRSASTLRGYHFLNESGEMTRMGIASSHMCDGMPMVRAHVLDHLNFSNLDIESLVSWLSIFAGGSAFELYNPPQLPKNLCNMMKHSEVLSEDYYNEKLHTGIAYIMYDWMTHRDIYRILQYMDISSFGSFIKVVLRVSSFIEEIKTILLGLEYFEEYNKLENYEERLFFGLVGNDSIHI